VRFLFSILTPGFVRPFPSVVRLLSERGHEVVLAFHRHKWAAGTRELVDELAGLPGVRVETDEVRPRRRDVWHELALDCKGNQIRCSLDRKELFAVNNNSFTAGKVGFWTKSDSVSYFGDTKIVYTPRETLAVMLVRQALKKYPRLLGLKIYGMASARKELHIVASNDAKELGQPAGKVEQDVVARDVVYCGREPKETLVTLPLHDRNGDAIAAVRVVLQPFPGQTEQAALARARPIVKEMEKRVRSAKDLTD